jgi:malonyl CoA-acyl carrier protein transacylase
VFGFVCAEGLLPEKKGEYAALASIGDVLPIETLIDVVFYRGLTMAFAVPRRADGSSDYGMVAVNPMRVHKLFSQIALQALMSCISELEGGALLEIVNYNVDNWQYVAAGSLRCLDILQKTLDRIVAERVDLRPLLAGSSGGGGTRTVWSQTSFAHRDC